jgi:hypothetical protein
MQSLTWFYPAPAFIVEAVAFGINQMGFDIEKPILALIAAQLDVAQMKQITLGGFRKRHGAKSGYAAMQHPSAMMRGSGPDQAEDRRMVPRSDWPIASSRMGAAAASAGRLGASGMWLTGSMQITGCVGGA